MLDEFLQANDVVCMIADDNYIGLCHRRNMTVLGDQRAKNLDQLCRIHVLGGHHPGDQFFGGNVTEVADTAGGLLAGSILLNANDVSGRDGGEIVQPQDTQKQSVHAIAVHWCVGNDGHAALQARVDDKGLASDFGNLGDEFVDIGILGSHTPGVFFGLIGCCAMGQADGRQTQAKQGEFGEVFHEFGF